MLHKFLNNNISIYFILTLALVFRTISLNQSFWLDEATSALVARMSVYDIFTKFLPGDFHPPLYYFVLRLWSQAVGYSEVFLRIPSIIFGLGTIYLTFLIGKEVANKKVGLVASLFLATSGLHIYYSQEARMYSLQTLLVCASAYGFVKILKKGRIGDFVFFALFLALSVSADYMSLFMLPVFFVGGLIAKKRSLWWQKFLISHIPVLIFGIFWSSVFVTQILGGLSVQHTAPTWWAILGQTSIKNILLIPAKFIFGRIDLQNNFLYIVPIAIVMLTYGYLCTRTLPSKDGLLKIVWLWLTFPILFAVVLSFKLPILAYFRLLFVLPVFYIILSVGIFNQKDFYRTIWLGMVLIVNLITSLNYLTNPKIHREDWKRAVNYIESQKNEKSTTLFVTDNNREAYIYYAPNAKISGPRELSVPYDQIWLMRYLQEVFDPNDEVRLRVESMGYKKLDEFNFRGISVWRYSKY